MPPVSVREAIARVTSWGNSTKSLNPGLGVQLGCRKTIALRRLSSTSSGSKSGSPRYRPRTLVSSITPSRLSVSSAYSSSSIAAFASSKGSEAKAPKRPGKSAIMRAAYSLHPRANASGSDAPLKDDPGKDSERIAVSIPEASIMASDFSGDQAMASASGAAGCPDFAKAST